MVRTTPDDEFDHTVLADVANHGWHLVAIADDEEGPAPIPLCQDSPICRWVGRRFATVPMTHGNERSNTEASANHGIRRSDLM